jgi:uncharacterized membrane protein YphA (DoxX/SURF4 family)
LKLDKGVGGLLQLMIVTVLLFVLFFGLGFILNMLMKTTWFPIYGYIMLVIGLIVYWGWGTNSLASNLSEYSFADYVPAIGGLIGAALSGWTIKSLREKGYQMF